MSSSSKGNWVTIVSKRAVAFLSRYFSLRALESLITSGNLPMMSPMVFQDRVLIIPRDMIWLVSSLFFILSSWSSPSLKIRIHMRVILAASSSNKSEERAFVISFLNLRVSSLLIFSRTCVLVSPVLHDSMWTLVVDRRASLWWCLAMTSFTSDSVKSRSFKLISILILSVPMQL